jgi:hypothetical protein
MPRPFSQSTAELVMQVTEAVHANGKADSIFVQSFCDLSDAMATNALQSAADLGLLKLNGGQYSSANPIVSFVATPDEDRKAALLRVVLESYEPFVLFRNRLAATDSADTAAQQTKTILDIGAHKEEIKDTLISFGTYTRALTSQGGGRYAAPEHTLDNQLHSLAKAANDQAAAEGIIREHIGSRADQLDRTEVIVPLSNALLNAASSKPSESVAEGARAVESFLARLATRLTVDLSGANGILQKLDKFRADNKLPKKIIEAAKYLGQVRNAADHGVDVDADVNNVWIIQKATGLQYVFVACSFITSALEREANGDFII